MSIGVGRNIRDGGDHTVSSKIHDKDAPLNGPLLNDNNRSSSLFLCNLNQVHRDLGRGNTNTDTVDEATSNEHADTITACLYSCPKQPPKAGKCDGITASDAVGYRTSHYGTNDGASSEGGTDATLSCAGRIVKVGDILLGSDDGGDGGDVEAEASRYQQGFGY